MCMTQLKYAEILTSLDWKSGANCLFGMRSTRQWLHVAAQDLIDQEWQALKNRFFDEIVLSTMKNGTNT